MITCKQCGRECKNYLSLTSHLKFCKPAISSKDYYDKYIKSSYDGICKTCGSCTKFVTMACGYNDFCCTKCANQNHDRKDKIIQSNLLKYGTPHPLQNKTILRKQEKTNLEKYGSNRPLGNKTIKDKMVSTIQDRYGCSNISQIESVKDKKVESSQSKFGTDYPFQSDQVKDKVKNSLLTSYGVDNIMKDRYFKNKSVHNKRLKFFNYLCNHKKIGDIKILTAIEDFDGCNIDNKYEIECLKCSTIFHDHFSCGRIPRCPKCYPVTSISNQEREVLEYIRSLGITNILTNSKIIIPPKELDIYLPDYNLAIEYNGLYWHSMSRILDSNYHVNKTNECLRRNITLIQIFEDEWINKNDIVKSRISNLLNKNKNISYARKCKVREISNADKKEFLICNHIQGDDVSPIRIGAFLENELVAVMTFNQGNITRKTIIDDSYELSRFCTKMNHSIVGIASRLLKYFTRMYPCHKIITFADRRWSQGKLYYQLGFDYVKTTRPNYWYIDGIERKHRYNYRKDQLVRSPNYSDDLSEKDIMSLDGYDHIYDCGNLRFEKIIKRI